MMRETMFIAQPRLAHPVLSSQASPCTAFDAATHTIQHLAALGGEVCSVHQP